MAPERTANTAQRKASAFKPLRPAPKSKATTKTTPRSKAAPARPPVEISSSEEDEAVDATPESAPSTTNGHPVTKDVPPTIPPDLLTRLLQHNFKDKRTRIGKEASAVLGKYMEIFVREAIARAAFERSEGEGGGGKGEDFLEVEDLEKLAPQLILDF